MSKQVLTERGCRCRTCECPRCEICGTVLTEAEAENAWDEHRYDGVCDSCAGAA